jgi:hypothetical protein
MKPRVGFSFKEKEEKERNKQKTKIITKHNVFIFNSLASEKQNVY